MCTTAAAFKCVPGLDLLLISNRDEFYARPTESAQEWVEPEWVIGGRDLEGGGSWLACSKQGRLANITNFREVNRSVERPVSRGLLVTDFLTSEVTARQFGEQCVGDAGRNGFNILLWDGTDLVYASNRQPVVRVLPPGVYAMSNGEWDSEWPKVRRARERLREHVRSKSLSSEGLLDILLDERQAGEEELPSTGVPRAWERILSSVFIRTADYGTRSSTIVRIGDSGLATLDEYLHEATTETRRHAHFEWQIWSPTMP